MIFDQVKRFIRILFFFFSDTHVLFFMFFPTFHLSGMVIFYINVHCLCLGWLGSGCILDFSMTHRKKANSLKLSRKGFKTQCASPLGARQPTAETKNEEKILSLEASQQHNHSFSCNSSNVPSTAINNVMKQITCYLSQLWSMESNWSNLGGKKSHLRVDPF